MRKTIDQPSHLTSDTPAEGDTPAKGDTPANGDTPADGNGHRYRWGVLFLFLAGVLWSLNGALIKLVYADGEGPHGVTIAFYRSLIAGLFLLPLTRGKWHTLLHTATPVAGAGDVATRGARSRRFPLPLRRSAAWGVVFFTLLSVCFVIATTMTEAANAIILQYTSTFWVFGLSPWLLKERPERRDLWIVGVAMVAVAIIFAGSAATSATGLVIALAAGLSFGLLTIMLRRMRDCDPVAVTVLNNLGAAVLLLPAVLWIGDTDMTAQTWTLLVVMGVVQFGVPYYLYALGLARVPAYHAALITMVEPVLVPVWTYFAVGEVVPLTTIVGGGLILVALLIFLLRHRRDSGESCEGME
ncbi:MAG: DMT family transporter [Planctomycetes bacterium]|nr:DMT family transporter [Planctomycetota bacterium]